MMKNDRKENATVAKFAGSQQFRIPGFMLKPQMGSVNIIVQFVIPGIRIQKKREQYAKLAATTSVGLKIRLNKTIFSQMQGKEGKQQAELVTMCFTENEAAWTASDAADMLSKTFVLTERFVGILSFCLGIRLLAVQRQYSVARSNGTLEVVSLPVANTSNIERTIRVPDHLLKTGSVTEEVFSALFWLRRGIAEHDSVAAYSALMVCLQIMARHLVQPMAESVKCKHCGKEIEKKQWGDTKLFYTLITDVLGVDHKKAKRMWHVRCAVVAHGGRSVTADVMIELTELKFDAADLAFKSINIAVGLENEEHRMPDQSFYITDAFLHAI